MNKSILARNDARFMGISAAMLAALLAALLAVFVLAKPSGAQTTATLTVDQTEVGFGAVLVDDPLTGTFATRTITVTNNGDDPIVIGGVKLTGDAGEILDFSTNIDPVNGLTVEAGGTNEFVVKFDPSVEGTREATLTLLEGLLDGAVITLTGETINLVNEAGDTVTGVDVSGSGTQTDPTSQPGAEGCTIVGTNNGETLTGTPDDDIICALGGRDRVNGLGGSDTSRGGGGNDLLVDPSATPSATNPNGPEADRLYGEGGKDRINSRDGAGDDFVNGGPKRDRIKKDKGDQGKRR
jgi:Ca2+-binding RTX toxin-like protein